MTSEPVRGAEDVAPSDGFFGWIIGSLAVCRTCSAMVPDHADAQLNHQRWHALNDGSNDAQK